MIKIQCYALPKSGFPLELHTFLKKNSFSFSFFLVLSFFFVYRKILGDDGNISLKKKGKKIHCFLRSKNNQIDIYIDGFKKNENWNYLSKIFYHYKKWSEIPTTLRSWTEIPTNFNMLLEIVTTSSLTTFFTVRIIFFKQIIFQPCIF